MATIIPNLKQCLKELIDNGFKTFLDLEQPIKVKYSCNDFNPMKPFEKVTQHYVEFEFVKIELMGKIWKVYDIFYNAYTISTLPKEVQFQIFLGLNGTFVQDKIYTV